MINDYAEELQAKIDSLQGENSILTTNNKYLREQLTALVNDADDVLKLQKMYFQTRKGLAACKAKEEALQTKINALKLKFETKPKSEQTKFF